MAAEFLVNTITGPGYQWTPDVVGLRDGGFVISWWNADAHDDIAAQIFTADGTRVGRQLGVNSLEIFSTGRDRSPELAALPNGEFVVVWPGYDDSAALVGWRMFSSEGDSSGDDAFIALGNDFDHSQPSVTSLADGGFVVSWTSIDELNGFEYGSNIKIQMFGSSGAAGSGIVLVNTGTATVRIGNGGEEDQANSAISALSGGGFVVVWEDRSGTLGDSSSFAIKAQIYSADATRVGNEMRVNSTTQGDQGLPDAAGLADGGFVVVWRDFSGMLGDSSGSSVKAQLFGENGSPIGSEFLVNTVTTGNQSGPRVSALTTGGFVVTWEDASRTLADTSGYGVKAQIFDPAGVKVGDEFLVNHFTQRSQGYPAIAALTDGGFVVAWEDESGTLGDVIGSSIKARIFDSKGNPIDASPGNDTFDLSGVGDSGASGGKGNDTYIVSSSHDTIVEFPAEGKDAVHSIDFTMTLPGNVENLILLGTHGTNGTGNNLHNSITGNGASNTLIGLDGNDQLYGAAGDDVLSGGAGNDLLTGGIGRDEMAGGPGNDTYVVENADDTLAERSGEGRDAVKSRVAWTLGANFEALELIGDSAISGRGNSLANSLTGNSAANTLSGSAGNDTLLGSGGGDTLAGGTGHDRLSGGPGADAFLFDVALPPDAMPDFIVDFGVGADQIRLDGGIFRSLSPWIDDTIPASRFRVGSAALDPDDYVIYDPDSGTLYYDADGSGASIPPIRIATLGGLPHLSAGDIVIVG